MKIKRNQLDKADATDQYETKMWMVIQCEGWLFDLFVVKSVGKIPPRKRAQTDTLRREVM